MKSQNIIPFTEREKERMLGIPKIKQIQKADDDATQCMFYYNQDGVNGNVIMDAEKDIMIVNGNVNGDINARFGGTVIVFGDINGDVVANNLLKLPEDTVREKLDDAKEGIEEMFGFGERTYFKHLSRDVINYLTSR